MLISWESKEQSGVPCKESATGDAAGGLWMLGNERQSSGNTSSLVLIVNFPIYWILLLTSGYGSLRKIRCNSFIFHREYQSTSWDLSRCTDMRHFYKVSIVNRIKCLQHTLGIGFHLIARGESTHKYTVTQYVTMSRWVNLIFLNE